MFFKKNVIERKASEVLANELLKTPNFHFTNTSYGGRCGVDVLGTIKMEKSNQEHLIQICLVRDGNWESAKYNLVKHSEGTYYKTDKQEHSNYEKDEVLATYYRFSSFRGDIYSDSETEMHEARKLSHSRENTKANYYFGSRSRERVIAPNTKLYDSLFTKCAKEKNIKYGTEIRYTVDQCDSYRYEGGEKVGITRISTEATFMYRNKYVTISLKKFSYKNPKAKFYN